MPGTSLPAAFIFSGRPDSHPSETSGGPCTTGCGELAPQGPGKAQQLHPAPRGPPRATAAAAAWGLRERDPPASLCPQPPSRAVPPAPSAAPAPLTHRHRRTMAGSAGPGGSGRGAGRGSGVGRCPLRPGSRPGPAPEPALPDGRCSSARGGQLGGTPGAGGWGLVLAGLCRDAFGSGWAFHELLWRLGCAVHGLILGWDRFFNEVLLCRDMLFMGWF